MTSLPLADAVRADTSLIGTLERFYRDTLRITGPVALHEPWFDGNEARYVNECLASGWVSSVGSFVDRFEAMLAERCEVPNAIATVNGTAALQVAFHALGVRPGDLVLCPAISFVATANAIAHCAAEPLFVDVEPETFGMDPGLLSRFLAEECDGAGPALVHRASGRRIAALAVTHVFGLPAAMDRLLIAAEERGLAVVEDAAEALGSRYGDRPCGTLGRVGTLSFNGNKTLTTGGGGALVTGDAALARRLKHLTTTARVVRRPWEFEHDEIGFNYRLPNLNAALGVAQLERLDERLTLKRHLHDRYARLLEGRRGVRLISEPWWGSSNHWLNALLFDAPADCTSFLEAANACGIQARACWVPLPELPMYRSAPRAGVGTPVARALAARLANLPSSPQLLAGIAADRLP